MALILPNSAFVHFHKTGGMWVREVIEKCGIPAYESGEDDVPLVTRTHCSHEQAAPYIGSRTSFAFVRRPLAWYKSYWSYRTNHNGWLEGGIDSLPHEDLSVWISAVMEAYPGYLGRRYRESLYGCDIIARTEELPTALAQILKQCREDFNIDILMSAPKANATESEDRYVVPSVAVHLSLVERKALRMWKQKRVW